MRLVFAGTPAVAATALRALFESEHEVVGVLTQPDRRAGRGRKATINPVKELALERDVPVLQPESPNDDDAAAQLAKWDPQCCPVVAYGAMLREPTLSIPAYGWVNLHFSLLPAWRGASAVQHAIIAGDEVTGASTFRIEEGLDTGPIYGHVTERLTAKDTTGDVLERLAESGSQLLVRTMDAIAVGGADPVPQPSEGMSYAPRIMTSDAQINWDSPAYAIDRHVRGMSPAPGAWTTLDGTRLKIGAVAVASATHLEPGVMECADGQVTVGTGAGSVHLIEVQPAGKRMMRAEEWTRGGNVPLRSVLGESTAQ